MLLSYLLLFSFFFNDPPTTEIYTLSLHDALPICIASSVVCATRSRKDASRRDASQSIPSTAQRVESTSSTTDLKRSEEHTSELQSRLHLVCRLLLEKKKKKTQTNHPSK